MKNLNPHENFIKLLLLERDENSPLGKNCHADFHNAANTPRAEMNEIFRQVSHAIMHGKRPFMQSVCDTQREIENAIYFLKL